MWLQDRLGDGRKEISSVTPACNPEAAKSFAISAAPTRVWWRLVKLGSERSLQSEPYVIQDEPIAPSLH